MGSACEPGPLTHDISTLVSLAFERVAAGRTMPGVFATRSNGPIGSTIEDLVLLAECSEAAEWEGRVLFLPMRPALENKPQQ